ncbi:MAG: glycoside hydrolase family 10 protein, partial [Chitinophagaceae bacterium]
DIQKQEMIAYLDKIKAANLNTVIFQIRPSADAFYNSNYEPYSYWLINKDTALLDYDPLEFAVKESHKRGLFIHAWINPYRMNVDTGKNKSYINNPLYQNHPEWFVHYGKGLVFNPAIEEIQNFIAHIVGDIVRGYDIDGIHFDDYFYPYPNPKYVFDDSINFITDPRGFRNKSDWRRDNINQLIRKVHDTIKRNKFWVEFGISPFGIWRNALQDSIMGSATNGLSDYDYLYADVLYWDKKGWIDYVIPQLYWYGGHPKADYNVLAPWWNKHIKKALLYIGKGAYLIDKNSKFEIWKTTDEFVRQDSLDRVLSNIQGTCYYSSNHFFKQADYINYLLQNYFQYRALTPIPQKMLKIKPPEVKEALFQRVKDSIYFSWKKDKNHHLFILYKSIVGEFSQDSPKYIVDITGEDFLNYEITDPLEKIYPEKYYIAAISKMKTENKPIQFTPKIDIQNSIPDSTSEHILYNIFDE